MHRDKSFYVIQNVDYALRILLLIEKEPRTMEDLQRETGLKPDRIERILATFVDREWLSYHEESGRYMLGVRCFELGRAYFQHLDVRNLAKPVLRDVVEKLKENAYLTTRIGYEVLYIEKYEVEKEVGILSRFGRVLPMYASASGKIFLAFFDEREIEDYFKKVKWVRYTQNTKEPEEVKRELKEIRERGFSVNLGEYEEDVVSIAAPVFDYAGKVSYTVSVVAPAYRVPKE
ncbi:DNA-binding IclR family transcriptional regulator [Hydrogenivirga caldilitoris]|uniref:DNA-binding IclR family transcriptional regulator n=1 Tax=Hydrogenivirga caldilitoris TaxID=246264 RepID=A0A497XMT6_9AQUI|nr:IclR family transcriptional regulator [Hydrogenivirga caldilitoris]RLJ70158.1 DNA-binding IclR family transcriptional regulator [Hydrogenivirga caldilitoris]